MTAVSPTLKDLPKVSEDLQSELIKFDHQEMKHTTTQEKIVLPTAADVAAEKAEKTQKAVLDCVAGFDTGKLKHIEPQEKNPLPDKSVIAAEKEQQEFIAGIENFDQSKLKHAVTEEKNPLPTKEAIALEKTA